MVLSTLLVGLTPQPAQATIADKRNDFNGDGVSDLLARGMYTSDCLYRWDGDGAGNFKPREELGCGWDNYSGPVSPGDITGDGKADLVAIKWRGDWGVNCLYRWPGNGNGTFGNAAQIGCGWNDFNKLTGMDLNNDGRGDLVAVKSTDSCLYRWMGNGNGGFGNATKIGCGWGNYGHPISPGDITGDGNADIIAEYGYPTTGCMYRFNGTGTGWFGQATMISCDWGHRTYETGMGDTNRDGHGDLVYLYSDGLDDIHLSWAKGDGRGGFSYHYVGPGWTGYYPTS